MFMCKELISFEKTTQHGKKCWTELKNRLIEHNIRIISNYYTRIHLKRMSELLDMLDGDFIAKNLGQLSPMQESKLVELRKLMKTIPEIEKCPSCYTLYRFLKARDFHVDKAFQSLQESIRWRRENKVDTLLNEYKLPSVVMNHFPGGRMATLR